MRKLKFWPRSRPKIWIAFFSIATLGGVVLVFFAGPKEPGYVSQNQLLFPRQIEWSSANLDSDGDGLKNWEEELYKTDKQNPDSDGDGANDGEEIAQNRNPLKTPPDQVVVEEAGPKTDLKPSVKENNLTSNVAESFIKTYFDVRARGAEFNPQNITQQILKTVDNGSPLLKTFKKNDLKIVATENQQKVSAYLNSVASIAGETLLNWDTDPLQLVASVLQQENFKEQLYRFDPFVKKTETALKKFLDLEVPESWGNEHLKLLNNVLVLNTAVTAMRSSDKDIIFMLTTLTPFTTARESLRELLLQAQKRVAKESLQFSKEDPMGKLLALRLE